MNIETNETILYSIKELNKLLFNDFKKRLDQFGLTPQQGRILFYINSKNTKNENVNQKEIENHFHLSKSTVSGLITRLIKKELIQKDTSNAYVNLIIKDCGKNIINEFIKGRKCTISKLFDGLNETEQKQIKNYINRMIDNMGKEK